MTSLRDELDRIARQAEGLLDGVRVNELEAIRRALEEMVEASAKELERLARLRTGPDFTDSLCWDGYQDGASRLRAAIRKESK